ncbi:uncharacterized protein LOC123321525 [Coccinella septempunctata]|uniref:uncharacterized protein LOC123321525 n=1 Tax=Coccinella septempunctata TaxID=41139 RepID=UPI001D074204|nr:uncharacterized protein LOC123321525 [Coccinella septempunctata]XP_044765114.1 uncharacterized protein LOC123321525 [Coccinella septempunctata]
MFGSKFRSWMEAVRPRKKQHRKDKQIKLKNNIDATSPKLSFAKKLDAGKSPKNKKEIKKVESGTSTNDPLRSEPTSSRYSVATLSSPESAYSTGYSTDGTSPGAPPDYYAEVKIILEPKPPIRQCDNNPSIHQTIHKIASPLLENNRPILNKAVDVASPRQRNRIRTNPWLPRCTSTSGRQIQNSYSTGLPENGLLTLSNQCVAAGPCSRGKSPLSSTCSSLSGGETYWEGSEDDCTLNEMMGKYDESYVYEKETDILSDSEPTDLDTDIDTGQDGGDELEPQEGDMFYIDEGPLTEMNTCESKNTGHCSYFNFQEKRKASRRKTTRKSRHNKLNSHRKRTPPVLIPEKTTKYNKCDGSRSVGATPLFARRTQPQPVSKLALDDSLVRRSNSVNLYRNPIDSIDKKDEEAEQKYEQLIVEAEHILRNMKTEGLSPRRLPGPANKRVELLRSTECSKTARVVNVPSTNLSSVRMLPRCSHAISTVPGLNSSNTYLPRSPIPFRKHSERQSPHRSPKHKKKSSKIRRDVTSSSSDDERPRLRAPPQSEPVKRKVYATFNKNIIIHPNNCNALQQRHRNSAESLRHQVLINTIANLKKSLEDQSASLKQAYRSPQH